MGSPRRRRAVALDLDARIVLAVAVGSAAGGTLRYLASSLLNRPDLPWGTFFVNLTGSLVLGYLVFGPVAAGRVPEGARAFLAVGLLGSYTTMATFSVETVALATDGRMAAAGWNWFGNAVACVLGAGASAWLAVARAGGG